MARVLHLLEGGDVALARAVIERQRAAGDAVSVALLPGGDGAALPAGVTARRVPGDLTWEALLEEIFAADQVIAW
jgi:hypothetical protein